MDTQSKNQQQKGSNHQSMRGSAVNFKSRSIASLTKNFENIEYIPRLIVP
jgi:hypothetical protein